MWEFVCTLLLLLYYFIVFLLWNSTKWYKTLNMKISLNKRKLKDGRISLSIEYYRGSEINEQGKRRHLRSFENLETYLVSEPKTVKDKKQNKQGVDYMIHYKNPQIKFK